MTTTTGTTPRLAPGQAYDVSDPVFRANPYPRYAELRALPEPLRTADGLRVLTHYDQVLAAVRDRRLSSNPAHATSGDRPLRNQALGMFPEGTLKVMLLADAPDHTRLRRLANRAFTPRAVERLRPWIESLVEGMLDDLARSDEPEVMHAIAEPLPVYVICELLGVPASDQERFKPWSDAVARMIDGDATEEMLQAAIPAVMGFVTYFNELIEKRRADPRDDLLSGLIHAEEDGESMTPGELFAMLILLFIAGHETTTNLIGNGTLALLRNPDEFALLGADPALAPTAVEELLRFDSPVQITVRTATEDVSIGDLVVPAGESVVCGLAAGNRDPNYVSDPDRLDLRRGDSMHLSFSNGMHHCLGAPLARLEGQLVLAGLARRFPNLALATDEPPYRDHFILRGLSALPVTGLG